MVYVGLPVMRGIYLSLARSFGSVLQQQFFFPLRRDTPTPTRCARVSSMSRFHDYTQAIIGKTTLDEGSALCRDLYLTTQNIHKRQTSMNPAGFEPAIPAREWPQTHAKQQKRWHFYSVFWRTCMIQVYWHWVASCQCLGSWKMAKWLYIWRNKREFCLPLYINYTRLRQEHQIGEEGEEFLSGCDVGVQRTDTPQNYARQRSFSRASDSPSRKIR